MDIRAVSSRQADLAARDDMSVTPEQCRAARALLDWSQSALAEATGSGQSTIAKFERGVRNPHASTLKTIRTTLEAAGVEFIDENGGGPGVRLRQRRR